MGRRYFGTDGVRGKVGESPITPEFVMHLGYAAGRIFSKGARGKPAVLLGNYLQKHPDDLRALKAQGLLQIASEQISATLDLAALATREAAEEYTVKVVIESIKSAASGIAVSSNLNLYTATFKKSARSEDALVVGESDYDFSSVNYFDMAERTTKWTVSQITPGIDGGNDPKRILDGNGGTDFASNNRGFSFVVDFGKVVPKFRGIVAYYWADWAAPREIQLECSVDGVKWTNLGRADISGLSGNAKALVGLKKSYPARYVRYTITKPVGRTSVTEFYAFEDVEEANADDFFGGENQG